MIVIEDVFKSLESNPNIENENVKNDLKSLIVIFNEKYPKVDLSALNEKIASVRIENSSKLTFNAPMNYNPRNNIIMVNTEEVNKGYDVENLFMNCIVKMVSSTKDSYGFVDNDKYAALNAGITAQISNELVGNGEDFVFDYDELVESNLIASIVGVENLFTAYFQNDKVAAKNMFSNEKVNSTTLEDINALMDYGYSSNLEVSTLCDVEKKLIDILFSKERTEDQVELFDVNLITNNICMNYPDKYMDINDIGEFFNKSKQQYMSTINYGKDSTVISIDGEYEINRRVK